MQVLVASGKPSMTERVVREAISLISGLSYFSLVYEDRLRILFIRPWGKMGQGIWVRRVSDGPAISPPWGEGCG